MAYGAILGQNPNLSAYAKKEGLPVNDIRTYPVREGQSISAGDVVNVGKEVISGTTYGDFLVGSTVQINENGSPVNYLVVHQGNPDPDLYDASCDGTWLLRKDIAENRVWDAGNVNAYADSDINDYLNGGWLGRYDSTTLGNIKQVKIPYCVGNGSSTINSGANGLSVKAFFLGGSEVGWSSEDNQYFSADGAKLDFFMASDGQSANQKRIAALNGLASTYALRSPISDANGRILSVLSDGFCNGIMCQYSLGIRPCIIFDSAALLGDDIVYGPDTIYKDIVPQDNVENLLYSTALSDISLCYLNDDFSIAALKSSANSITDVYMVNNKTGLGGGSSRLSSDYHQYVKVAKLSDTKFISLYVGSSVYSKIGTVSGTSISFGSQYTVASSASNNADVIALSDILALAIYNSSGLKCKVLPISGTTITTSGTVYSLSGNTDANYISACRLPDEGGNKRVCICFSDTGDGNKGKAVVATIDSSNVVTFGNVVTFESGSATAIKCAASEDTVCVAYIVQSQTYVTYITAIGSTITVSGKKEKVNYGTSYYCDIAEIGDKFVCAYSETQGFARTVSASDEITMGAPFMLNDDLTNYPSIAVIGDNHLILAYSDSGNSNYGTTTILEVNGNQIAGSFLDNSSDAIALADGTGGQSIPVGFGGYCECPGVTEGETIDSAGVIAQAVQDGWLQIKSAWDKGYVVGTYTGDGTSNRLIDIGFTPTAVIVANRGDLGANDTGIDYSAAFGITGNPGRAITYGNSPILVETTDNGFIVNTGFYNTSSGTNMNTNLYYYIALR